MAKQLGIWSTAILVLLLALIKLPPQQRMALIGPLEAVTAHFHGNLVDSADSRL